MTTDQQNVHEVQIEEIPSRRMGDLELSSWRLGENSISCCPHPAQVSIVSLSFVPQCVVRLL